MSAQMFDSPKSSRRTSETTLKCPSCSTTYSNTWDSSSCKIDYTHGGDIGFEYTISPLTVCKMCLASSGDAHERSVRRQKQSRLVLKKGAAGHAGQMGWFMACLNRHGRRRLSQPSSGLATRSLLPYDPMSSLFTLVQKGMD